MTFRRSCLIGLALAAAGCGSTTTRTVTQTTTETATTPAAVTTTPTTPPTPTVTTTPAVTTPPSQPVYFQGASAAAAQHPATLELTGDGTLFVQHVQWSSWGGPTATGSGDAEYHGCSPNCASAPVHTALVSIRMSGIRTCGGRQYYAGLTLTLSSGRLLDPTFVQRSWSPC